MNIKALCTDIDGTLLNSKRELSPRTIAAFKNVADKIPVVLASSRMPAAMRHLQHELGVSAYPIICYNGGYVVQYNINGEITKVFDSVCIPVNICEAVVDLARNTSINVSLYFEDEWYAPQFDYWTEREQRITKADPIIEGNDSVISRWKQKNQGAHKIMCMGPEGEISAIEKKLTQDYGEQIHVYFSRATYLELAPKSLSKASALEKILNEAYNISMSDVISFGDNYNDIELLAKSGLGIAVANGRDEAKAVAKEITLKSIDDGVAVSIEKYLLAGTKPKPK
jgi:Cof subfamily protein (haloacid dehalogenase superfamily)